ncbi:hypothetical protein LTR09_002528 [Extremus antarcticus]|uniref:Spindle pole body component n=1 Tax=Extremus antarcticus TaxID=702011 RepID=A0AAJ0GFU3_9PEZI|nr:hypothetical protein LTR09_002528 [Extremus antarcticus]
MEDPFAHGFPFELSDIWRQSALQPDETTHPAFQLPDLQTLEFHDADVFSKDIFDLPDLPDAHNIADQERDNANEVLSDSIAPLPPSEAAVPEPFDIWAFEHGFEEAPKPPQVFSWEAFEKKAVIAASRVGYLSEAGPRAFDAALSRLEIGPGQKGVLPQDVMLRALCNLALGRSSVFFTWDEVKKSFVASLPDVPISGLSQQISSSLVARLVTFGSMYRTLGEFAALSRYATSSATALIALKGCFADVLGAVEEYLVRSTGECRSILQLQTLIEQPYHLLSILLRLKDAVDGKRGDGEVISAVSACVHEAVAADGASAEVLRIVLARTCAPWLGSLCSELGLEPKQYGIDAGPSTGREASQDDSSAQMEQSTQTRDAIPSCVSDSDRALIKATKESVTALRQHMPEHTLDADRSKPHEDREDDEVRPNRGEMLAWDKEEDQQRFLATLDARISRPATLLEERTDGLKAVVSKCFRADATYQGLIELLSIGSEVDLLDSLRPSIIAHQKLMNESLLRHAFHTLKLRHHLDLQHQYHLLGNGDFVARFATALFSTDTQSAERQRGTIPTAETIGLRLGGRGDRRWPPASSELRLSLMGVLTETYTSGIATRQQHGRTKELPGGLSFSIRELPDAEIERVMDAESIYALDFLRLQYTPPSCLDSILSHEAMQVYDSIFRLLLRLLRVLYVTTKLRENLVVGMSSRHRRQTGSNGTSVGFVYEAHHVMLVLMSHTMDVGIGTPWQAFMRSLDDVEKIITSEGSQRSAVVGLDDIRQLHEQCLERIRSRLFLRRKQEKLRTAVEAVLASILACASVYQKADITGGEIDTRSFRKSLTELHGILRDTVEKPPKGTSVTDADEDDAEAMKILTMRLRYEHTLT